MAAWSLPLVFRRSVRRVSPRCHATIPPLMHPTPQRENGNGHPVDLGDAWIFHKDGHVAVTHRMDGWSLPPGFPPPPVPVRSRFDGADVSATVTFRIPRPTGV
jgi:hypothetical protein